MKLSLELEQSAPADDLDLGDCCFTDPNDIVGEDGEVCSELAVVVIFAPVEYDGIGACARHYRKHQDSL